MRQVFSSQRLENVEAVAQLLREADIEVRITNGRSYKGSMRSRASYSDQSAPKPAVWVVHSEDHVRAREILRDNGLLESTRPTDSFQPLSFRDVEPQDGKTPAQRRMFRFKLILLGGMGLIIVLAMLRGCYSPRPAATTGAPAPAAVIAEQAPREGGTPESLALAVFARELEHQRMVLCLAIDDVDASGAIVAAMSQPSQPAVPASKCIRDADPDRGSFEAATGRPALLATVRAFKATGPDSGTVEFEAFHHGQDAHYKTLEVKRVDGAWQVVKVLRHVASFSLSG